MGLTRVYYFLSLPEGVSISVRTSWEIAVADDIYVIHFQHLVGQFYVKWPIIHSCQFYAK